MKITTANIKNASYLENHEIYVGTHTGSFKRNCYFFYIEVRFLFLYQSLLSFTGIDLTDENPHKQTNLETIQALNNTSRVTTLDWGTDKNEILIGRINPVVKVYNTKTNNFAEDVTIESGPIVGLARYDGKIVAGMANGKIQIGERKPTFLTCGDAMSRMRQCKFDQKLVATGGKERQNNLKVWNLETNECTFRTKNVPNDFLQLEVPIWDSDFAFYDANCLTSCSRYGYIRVYDMRKQRRPVHNFTNDKEQISYACLAVHEDLVFSGTTTGILHAFDLRKMKHVLHTYKGFSGSISDIGVDDTGKYVVSSSLDRFVRVHCTESTILQYQCYVKSKATKVLLKTCESIRSSNNNESTEAADGSDEESDDRNQINLKHQDSDDAEFDELFDKMPTVE